MLNIDFHNGRRDCSGMLRRDFLRVGTLSIGGLALPNLLAAQAAGEVAGKNYVKNKSVVLLYLSGGASQFETFDPKITAAENIRSATGEVKTSISGVTFGGTFPKMAALADKLAIVRSHAHKVGNHSEAHVHVLSGGTDPAGKQKQGFSMGSAYSQLRGTNHERTGLPTYITLNEREIDKQYLKEFGRFNNGSWPGELGQSYSPLNHQIGWESAEAAAKRNEKDSKKNENPVAVNMRLNLPQKHLDNRMQLLKSIDIFNRQLDASRTMESLDDISAQALTLLAGDANKAFDLSQESPKTIERYDTSHIDIGFKVFRPSTLGKQLLLARRLCESGAGFVSIQSAGWDMHADGNNPGVVKGMEMLGNSMDHAVSAFLQDVEDRGLSDQILLVIIGDFGRTPKLSGKAGRGHWAKLCPLVFAGGGLNMGQVIGRSNENGESPATDPIGIEDVMTTVMHALFDMGQMRLDPTVPRKVTQHIAKGKPVEELF